MLWCWIQTFHLWPHENAWQALGMSVVLRTSYLTCSCHPESCTGPSIWTARPEWAEPPLQRTRTTSKHTAGEKHIDGETESDTQFNPPAKLSCQKKTRRSEQAYSNSTKSQSFSQHSTDELLEQLWWHTVCNVLHLGTIIITCPTPCPCQRSRVGNLTRNEWKSDTEHIYFDSTLFLSKRRKGECEEEGEGTQAGEKRSQTCPLLWNCSSSGLSHDI